MPDMPDLLYMSEVQETMEACMSLIRRVGKGEDIASEKEYEAFPEAVRTVKELFIALNGLA